MAEEIRGAMELTDEEIGNVSGGMQLQGDKDVRTTTAYCPTCGKKTTFKVYSGARGVCTVCGQMTTI